MWVIGWRSLGFVGPVGERLLLLWETISGLQQVEGFRCCHSFAQITRTVTCVDGESCRLQLHGMWNCHFEVLTKGGQTIAAVDMVSFSSLTQRAVWRSEGAWQIKVCMRRRSRVEAADCSDGRQL